MSDTSLLPRPYIIVCKSRSPSSQGVAQTAISLNRFWSASQHRFPIFPVLADICTPQVLGGSSAVGAAAIQLLRLALPDATILATSSPKHNELVTSHGATAVINYKSTNLVEEIKKASPNGEGVEAILDAVNGVQIEPSLLQVLTGPKYFAEVATGYNVKDVPADVKHSVVIGTDLFNAPGGKSALAVLGKLVDEGKYKLPVPVTVVGKGFDAIGQGLKTLKDGVSGTKLVVTL